MTRRELRIKISEILAATVSNCDPGFESQGPKEGLQEYFDRVSSHLMSSPRMFASFTQARNLIDQEIDLLWAELERLERALDGTR